MPSQPITNIPVNHIMIIKAFIARIKTLLEDNGLGAGRPAVFEGPAIPPPVGQLPRIVVSAGKLEMPPPFGDAPPGQARPRDIREHFPVNINAVQGPYTLAQMPLDGTVSCRLTWRTAGENLEGKKIRVYPRKGNTGDGFTVDYENRRINVFYAQTLADTPELEVEYAYAAIFTLREFRQMLLLEAYADMASNAEKWASLAAAVLLTNADTLLEDSNQSGNVHSNGNYTTTHLIGDFQWAEGLPEQVSSGVFRYTVQFRTSGQVILARTLSDFGVIERIFSPGQKNAPGVINIEANLD